MDSKQMLGIIKYSRAIINAFLTCLIQDLVNILPQLILNAGVGSGTLRTQLYYIQYTLQGVF
jgi:hypothetical protein